MIFRASEVSVSVISKSSFSSCANFLLPYLSEASLGLSAGHPFEFGECVSEIEGNRPPIGKSVSASLRVRDVRASGRGEAVWACETGVFVNMDLRVVRCAPALRFALFVFVAMFMGSWVF